MKKTNAMLHNLFKSLLIPMFCGTVWCMLSIHQRHLHRPGLTLTRLIMTVTKNEKPFVVHFQKLLQHFEMFKHQQVASILTHFLLSVQKEKANQ